MIKSIKSYFLALACEQLRDSRIYTEGFNSLKSVMDQLNAMDWNLAEKMATLDRHRDWSFEPIYTAPEFEINLLMIPQGRGIPLHDHPQMKVWLKVLWGTLSVQSYDWAEDYPYEGLAHLTQRATCNGATETLCITPKQYNLHEIYATENCAFLDVLFPPYSDERPCHYYQKKGSLHRNGERLFRLVSE
ncbi:MAG: hypothetical protein AABZ60_02745 [Planctomycetota bacterium]